VITITGISDHLRLEWPITITGMRSRGIAGSRHHRSDRRCGAERRNCGEELAAMPDRGHPDADQVVGRQLRQHFAIDIVVSERSRVLFEPQPA
jgi:hypothetical protein